MWAVYETDRGLCEAQYDSLSALVTDWWAELVSGTHFYAKVKH